MKDKSGRNEVWERIYPHDFGAIISSKEKIIKDIKDLKQGSGAVYIRQYIKVGEFVFRIEIEEVGVTKEKNTCHV